MVERFVTEELRGGTKFEEVLETTLIVWVFRG
jgi:hypothetical protein